MTASLLVYNTQGVPITLVGLASQGAVVPASASPPAVGVAYDATAILSGLSSAEYSALETQRVMNGLLYQWSGGAPAYPIGELAAEQDAAYTAAAIVKTIMQGQVTLIRVDAPAAVSVHAACAFNAAFPLTTAFTAFAHPRTVELVTGGGWTAATPVVVKITGSVRGVAGVIDTITIPAVGTTTEGVLPFDPGSITSINIIANAGWTAGNFTVKSGTKLGLPMGPNFSAITSVSETTWDETASPPTPTYEAVTATDTANGTFKPGTTPNANHSYSVVYGYTVQSSAVTP